MKSDIWRLWLALLATWACIGSLLPAAGTVAADPPATLREMIDATVQQLEVYPDPESKEPAKPLVVLRWANNQRGSEDGLTMLYIHGGKPLAAACLYPWAGNLVHDFEAVGRGSVLARKDGGIVWLPVKSGVTFADIPGAPPPAHSAALRLRQMKTLAEEFESTLVGWKQDNTDREELRLLTRPLYRYEPAGGEVIDGAVFAFAMGTDPESLLLIEAIKTGDASKWQFAFARRTSGELEGRHRGKVVWKAARYPANRDPRQPHFAIPTPIPPAIVEALRTGDQASP